MARSNYIVIDARNRRSSTGRYTDRLLEHLQRLDNRNRYTVLIQTDDAWKPKAPNFSVQPCRYAQFSFNPFEQLGFAWQLYRLKPDLVHFTMTQQPVLYFRNTVTTTHDLTMLRFSRPGKAPLPIFWLKMLGYRFLFWWAHRKSRYVLTHTKYVAKELISLHRFTKNKVKVVPLASEPMLADAAEQPSGIKEPFLLYVGTAFPHKNLDRLVGAFERLAPDHPGLELVLVGKKEYYYEQLHKRVLESTFSSRIRLTGFLPDSQLKWLYQHAEAYVFPSLSEGFGFPGLEAMVHGCPVVSSKATCLPEVYGNAAHYFDPTDEVAMAEAITDVLQNKDLRRQLISRGRAKAAQYSWEHTARQTLNIYEASLSS